MYNEVTIAILQNQYSYDNIKTRNPLVVPELIKHQTEFNVLKPEKKINIVGLLLTPPRLAYSNFNIDLYNNLFSLNEITYYNNLTYSFDLFKAL